MAIWIICRWCLVLYLWVKEAQSFTDWIPSCALGTVQWELGLVFWVWCMCEQCVLFVYWREEAYLCSYYTFVWLLNDVFALALWLSCVCVCVWSIFRVWAYSSEMWFLCVYVLVVVVCICVQVIMCLYSYEMWFLLLLDVLFALSFGSFVCLSLCVHVC